MPRELERQMLRSRRMQRQIGEDAPTLFDPAVGISFAQQLARAGLVRVVAEHECAVVCRRVAVARTTQAPAGDCTRELGDVGLGVAAIHTERMQFEDFAGEVFVEPGLALGRVAAIAHRRVALAGA